MLIVEIHIPHNQLIYQSRRSLTLSFANYDDVDIFRRPALNKTCFDMPTIYIPEMVSKPTRCANHIEEVGKEIEKTINQTVQNTLNSLERDCDHIAELVRFDCVGAEGLKTACVLDKMEGRGQEAETLKG